MSFDEKAREVVSRHCIGGHPEWQAKLVSAISTALKEAVEEAKLQERSQCAQKFEDYYNQWVGVDDNRANAGRDAASAIRSRKEASDA